MFCAGHLRKATNRNSILTSGDVRPPPAATSSLDSRPPPAAPSIIERLPIFIDTSTSANFLDIRDRRAFARADGALRMRSARYQAIGEQPCQ